MPLKIERHMSVSRRMLSKVKQSISQRQKSSESIRPVESEANLMRRLSGKRKQSIGLETRTQSSEIGRPVDYCDHGAEAIVSYHGTSRSSSDSTTSMTEFSATSRSFTPPLSSMTFGQELTTPRLMSTSTTSVASNTSSQEPTPRPTRKKLPLLPEETCLDTQLGFPYVDLSVNVDCTCADASSQVAVWIAISASIHFKDIAVPCGADVHGRPVSISDHLKHNVVGQITSLKLCFKPTDECHLLDIVGQKAQKNPRHNRSCSIFVKVLLPAVVSQSTERDPDQDSLFTELESIVGTLETELLSVEARYRHSLFPQDNIITIRHRAKVNRATPNSRWSILDPENQLAHSSKVHVQLARYLAQHYPPVRAIELIERCLGAKGLEQVEVQQIYRNLMEFGNFDPLRESSMPAVVVTDIDRGSAYLSTQNIHIAHLPAETSTPENPLAENLPSEPSTDEARTLWRALRHSSLTEAQQAELSAPDRIDQLEAQDEKLLVLRRRALANKRSVGAETLKGWKWECASGSGGGGGGFGCEMPWR
ncbi:Hypothetical protein R9X50_00305300 [Acrodontium crateriforme]|uniref:Uncharacterized protein n=1 Tax=Acrodontium crateriforme TaxID=150365 RepID=A0AAQ3M3N4_9PEZI|nr:Hypothetical protein R9X50_00305300 [Acrodontium crateriforme]